MNFLQLPLLNTLLLHVHEHTHLEGSFGHALPTLLLEALEPTVEITVLVILMMSLIELVNVSSAGRWLSKLQNRPFLQVVIACLLGLIPGCAGGFAVVSLFTHNLLSFGALVGGMVATFGDESFFLFAKDPKSALLLSGVLLLLGVLVGSLLNIVGKKWNFALESHQFELHDECHKHAHVHTHEPSESKFYRKIAHFLREHLWEHVVKKHLLSIFLWSFFVIFFLHVMEFFFHIDNLMHLNEWAKYAILLVAVLVGCIPESGPNLIFVMMFLEGTIPFGILLANSISQNGHAGLPLLAQSRKNFFIMKGLTMLLGLLVGLLFLL